jgi:4-amino-4-deoxy-L-arabinose transferase-like glycosyltransferase
MRSPATRIVRLKKRLVPAIVAALACAVPFTLMATEMHFRASVPVGFVAMLVASWGILQALGTFDREGDEATSGVSLRALAPDLGLLVVSVVAHLCVLALCVAGVLPKPIFTAAVLVPATFLWAVVSTYRVGVALGAFRDDDGTCPALLRRHGFWLVALNVLAYVPMLGSYSLSDPWETHYGEVSREMLARDDWISLWWAQDGYFWSKPVLDFWSQGLSFSLLGVKYLPDQMLRAASLGRFPQPEWAARMPVFLMTLAGTYALYRAVAHVFGRRAGFISGVVLTSMPYWYLIAHQTMTDMPYVGTLTAAMALLLLGFVTHPDKQLRVHRLDVGRWSMRLSALHLVWVAVIVSTLPQVLYLASRNVALLWRAGAHGFRFHPEEFFAGSGGGNCGLPGNQACTPDHPIFREVFLLKLGNTALPLGIPLHLALVWAAVLGAFLWLTRKETRLARTYFLGAWYFLALSMLGKGAPGLVLPIASALGFIGVTRRWKELTRIELLSMLLIALCVGMPWYVQMFMRHGPPFIDRLIMHDMYKRAFVHVHDTNSGDDTSFRYYIWQLGYGLFPWTGIAAGGLLYWLKRTDRTRDAEGDAASLLFVWFIAAFGMFTITLTKFHHYILPLVPPVAVFAGLLVDRLIGRESPAKEGKLAHYLGVLTAGATLCLYGVMRLFPRRFMGDVLSGNPPSKAWGVLLVLFGLGGMAFGINRFGRPRSAEADDARARYERSIFAVIGIASAIVVALSGRDLMMDFGVGPNGSARLMQLFTYNYGRPWPDSLDFTPAFAAFTVFCVGLSFALAFNRVRRHAAVLLCVAGTLWTLWGLDVYLYEAAPHWGQREVVLAYYRDRRSADEPFVAYQMNWKGENFYTGNRVPAFVSSGERFKEWITEQKNKGIHRMYFTTEHGRISSLKRELGDPANFVQLTDKKLNNKFLLARVDF